MSEDAMLTIPTVAVGEAPETLEMARSYAELHNETLATLEWMLDKKLLNETSQAQWRQTLQSLRTISLALQAGFEPFTPPTTWNSGSLATYRGPIPDHVRQRIETALPIFGDRAVTVYDPRPNRFVPAIDPIVCGEVTLEGQKHSFLIGQWDLDQDLRYLSDKEEAGSALERVRSELQAHSSAYTGSSNQT